MVPSFIGEYLHILYVYILNYVTSEPTSSRDALVRRPMVINSYHFRNYDTQQPLWWTEAVNSVFLHNFVLGRSRRSMSFVMVRSQDHPELS